MIVDTDIIIRYFTNDDPTKADRFRAFIASGKKAQLTDVTFAEVYWTLMSFYKVDRDKILSMLEALIASPAIVSSKQVLTETIDILRKKKISFIDAYTVAAARIADKIILSYDRDFDNIAGIKRVEPSLR